MCPPCIFFLKICPVIFKFLQNIYTRTLRCPPPSTHKRMNACNLSRVFIVPLLSGMQGSLRQRNGKPPASVNNTLNHPVPINNPDLSWTQALGKASAKVWRTLLNKSSWSLWWYENIFCLEFQSAVRSVGRSKPGACPISGLYWGCQIISVTSHQSLQENARLAITNYNQQIYFEIICDWAQTEDEKESQRMN